MSRIKKHPILDIPSTDEVTFLFNGTEIRGSKGFTIAAALHQAGYPVHSHSIDGRNRSLECGIGKCGACEMMVDGEVRRICITNVDDVHEVREITPKDEYRNSDPQVKEDKFGGNIKTYRTSVVIIGAGPAGLAAREELNSNGVDNLVIDANARIGGQFLMQTHQFFFFEKEKKFGGMRGFEIAETLAGRDLTGIMLNCTVWDILEDKIVAVKKIDTGEIFYVSCDYMVIATGAVPFMPSFENDDLPGVYTAAVVQKMMNQEFTLLGKNVLTVGAGNIGYLTSYQLMQAGASVKAIIEAQENEGGFPVQANRVRRLGIPIETGKILIKAIPNENRDGIIGAVIADCKNFNPLPGSEKVIMGIDAINICTGLVPDDLLLTKGKEVFGRNVWGAGDAIRIGEGTSAVVRGQQVAYEIMEEMGHRYNYERFLEVSKEYIDSQQHPVRILGEPLMPAISTDNRESRGWEKPFVVIDCLYGFACNPCTFACPHGAITKSSTSTVPVIDYDKCTGCMQCVSQCPGLAIFGYNLKRDQLFLPVEFEIDAEGEKEVYLVDNNGSVVGEGEIEKVLKKPNKTNVVRIRATSVAGEEIVVARGFIQKSKYPEKVEYNRIENRHVKDDQTYICHCEDIKLDDVLKVIGDRKFISIDEIKHTTRLGMGACRGKRCARRLKTALVNYGIQLVGDPTPRAPMSNQVSLGDMLSKNGGEVKELNHNYIVPGNTTKVRVGALVAGGGIGGSSLFRFMAEAGMKPVLVNYGYGSSWRNIAGGRPVFSIPELADIASHNLRLFGELQEIGNIDFRKIQYVTFAHDEATYKALEDSMSWQDAVMIEKRDFARMISPAFNPDLDIYSAAQITNECWQATPGRTVDLLRQIGISRGGVVEEDCQLISVARQGDTYFALVKNHRGEYVEYETPVFVNAMGAEGAKFARETGIETGLYPVKHQAFITSRLPMLGVNDRPLPMLIDRRKYKGFSAVYGQQLAETGQVIGCASPQFEPAEAAKNLKINSRDFMEIVSEVFTGWLPGLKEVSFQAVWSGYYIEPRMYIDPAHGLFLGLRGQGFMLGQYLASMYVDTLTGKPVPDYFKRLSISGDGLLESAFK